MTNSLWLNKVNIYKIKYIQYLAIEVIEAASREHKSNKKGISNALVIMQGHEDVDFNENYFEQNN